MVPERLRSLDIFFRFGAFVNLSPESRSERRWTGGGRQADWRSGISLCDRGHFEENAWERRSHCWKAAGVTKWNDPLIFRPPGRNIL